MEAALASLLWRVDYHKKTDPAVALNRGNGGDRCVMGLFDC